MKEYLLTVSAPLVTQNVYISGHDYTLDPPGSTTAWGAGFSTPANYDDNGLNCGGYNNGGKCGVCGDDYSSTNNQQEPGSGIVPITYNAGQYSKYWRGVFPLTVRLYYQNNIPQKGSNPSVAVKKYCLNANQKLKASNGDTR
ncbi:hypothetical protein EB796_023515 [Bugula neritina]|uniref:Uncharacterized protein n=1 Tax=Bugula neritina TaxID=10212 RepID=A0A7J7IXC8_BUGNE|nr:hypothetical protein EB796_023515 [Bugula neritina]